MAKTINITTLKTGLSTPRAKKVLIIAASAVGLVAVGALAYFKINSNSLEVLDSE